MPRLFTPESRAYILDNPDNLTKEQLAEKFNVSKASISNLIYNSTRQKKVRDALQQVQSQELSQESEDTETVTDEESTVESPDLQNQVIEQPHRREFMFDQTNGKMELVSMTLEDIQLKYNPDEVDIRVDVAADFRLEVIIGKH